jgi:hypothetical protein
MRASGPVPAGPNRQRRRPARRACAAIPADLASHPAERLPRLAWRPCSPGRRLPRDAAGDGTAPPAVSILAAAPGPPLQVRPTQAGAQTRLPVPGLRQPFASGHASRASDADWARSSRRRSPRPPLPRHRPRRPAPPPPRSRPSPARRTGRLILPPPSRRPDTGPGDLATVLVTGLDALARPASCRGAAAID